MEDNKPDTPVTLKIDPSFMDTWTPLPDNTHGSKTTHTGKITTHRERRQQRIQLSTSAYKSYTIQHRADAKQVIEAAQSNDKERLLQLLISGKSAKLADDKGRTALHVACAKGLPDIVDVLLKHGADPNQLDVNGNTAFHLAVVTNKAEVMTLLVNAGCRIDVHSKPGVYPVGLMRNRIHRLQNQSRISKDDLHRETVMNAKLEQALSLRQAQEQEEQMSKLSSLQLTPDQSTQQQESDNRDDDVT